MSLFLCPSRRSLGINVQPGTVRAVGNHYDCTASKILNFVNGQLYLEDTAQNKPYIEAIRNGPDFKAGIIIEVADSGFKENKDLTQEQKEAALQDERMSQMGLFKCPECGQVCKNAFGLAAHMRRCLTKGKANEPASDVEPALAGGSNKS